MSDGNNAQVGSPPVSGTASDVQRNGGPAVAQGQGKEEDVVEKIYISPWAFLRTMAAIAWSCFRHPLTTTEIDISTGRILKNR